MHLSIRGERNPAKRPEVREKIAASKRGDLNPARIYREEYAERIKRYRPRRVSKLEDRVAKSLLELERQYQLGAYKIDFCNVQDKTAVEINGCFWHSCPKCFPLGAISPSQQRVRDNDNRRNAFLAENGWRLLVLWEHELTPDVDILSLYRIRLMNDG